ncbi:MAG: YihY/virulence factor BrkB family protein [Lachnospiraceae bacterium]|nr:YihY/virulence factor BrkB family protein [Lachnospiraceae bacterium]
MIKSFFAFCNKFSKKVIRDAVTAYSGEAALYIIISLFPFLMFLLTLLKYLPFTQEELLIVLSRFVPNNIFSYIESLVEELYTTSGTVLSITIVLALWSASRGILTVYRGLNSVYGIDETRNYFFLRLKSMLYTLVLCIMLIMLLGLYVFGNQIISGLSGHFPFLMHSKLANLIISFRTTIGAVILMVIFVIMYNFMPNRRSKIRKNLLGAVVAACGWVGFSYLYSIYIDHMGRIKATYGSLTAAVLCIIWLYVCMMIFFIGAEVNTALETPEVQGVLAKIFKKKNKAGKRKKSNEEVASEPQNDPLPASANEQATDKSPLIENEQAIENSPMIDN